MVSLNTQLNGLVNDEDKVLVERIQRGARSNGYVPGPLSHIEATLALNHKRFRDVFPIAHRDVAPQWGSLSAENDLMKSER